MGFLRLISIAAVIIGGLCACSNAEGSPERVNDPYVAFLEIMPDKPDDWGEEWPMSRENAQARALMGCGRTWAPGTIDAALQEAYKNCPE